MQHLTDSILAEIRNCRACEKHLVAGVRPVVAANHNSKILIIGHAPGRIVHETGIPWNDKSGDNLRAWLGVDKLSFYDIENFALVPIGFCYPGKGKTGDLPPRNECAPLWHETILASLRDIELVLLVGQYAQQYYLGSEQKCSLTERVKNFHRVLPQYFPLPHPSPRNNIWMKKNGWFEEKVLPELKERVGKILFRQRGGRKYFLGFESGGGL